MGGRLEIFPKGSVRRRNSLKRTGVRADIAQRYSQILYTIAYLLLAFKFLFDASGIIPWSDIVDDYIVIISFLGLMLVKLLLQRYTLLQLIGSLIVLALCIISSGRAKYFSPLLSLLLILGIQDVDLNRIMRISYRCKAAVLAFHIICYSAFIVVSPESLSFVYREGVVRHAFFLGHPNFFSACAVWTWFEYIYVNYNKLRAQHLLIILLTNFVMFFLTDSRSGLYIIIATIIMIVVNEHVAWFTKIVINPIAKYGFGFFSLLCVILTTAYTPALQGKARDIWLYLNDLLTGRLAYGAYAYNSFGLTWLGRTLSFPNKVFYNGHWMDGILFDISYQWLLIIYGSVFLVIISFAFFFLAKRMEPIEKIIVVAFTVYAFLENYAVNIAICFPLLLIAKYLYQPRRESEKIIASKEGAVSLWKQKSV